jgi:hypothetical protein
MSNPSSQEKLKSLRGYSKAMIQAMRVMDQRRHILEPLIDDRPIQDALVAKINGTDAVSAYNQLVPIFALDFVRDLARLFLDTGKKVGSLENVWRKASEPAVHAQLKNEFRQIPDKWYKHKASFDGFTMKETRLFLDEMLQKHQSEFSDSFDAGWRMVESGLARMRKDPVSKKLKVVRDKYQAHFEMTRIDEEPEPLQISELHLKYEQLFGFSDSYLPVAYELNRIITGTIYDFSESTRHHREAGRALWKVLGGLESSDAN